MENPMERTHEPHRRDDVHSPHEREGTPTDGVRAYVLLAPSPTADVETLRAFARRLGEHAGTPLEEATGARWMFHVGDPLRIEDGDPRHPSDFLREAHLRMVQSPADVVLVVTDAAVVSDDREIVPGLASPEANVAVVSTRRLRMSSFGDPTRPLDAEPVRWNAAALLVHLVGHLLGLEHASGGGTDGGTAMAPFAFEEERRGVPPFRDDERRRLGEAVGRLAEREVHAEGWRRLRAHLAVAARHPRAVFAPAVRGRAPLLPLRLTKMAAGALVPVFVILFTDEFWWVGLHLDSAYVWSAAAAAVLAAAWFVPVSQRLFFPHREKRVLTEHVALVNVAIQASISLAMLGLFAMVTLFVLLIEWWLFPEDFIAVWFEGRGFTVTWHDRLHIALVVSTLGTLTGALGGGFHGRDIVRELALFLREP